MEKQERDEHLETIWHLIENNESDVASFQSHSGGAVDAGVLAQLREDGYINLHGEQIALTDKGSDSAKQIIRRHRLAERLLTDVLGMALGDIEPGACEFEHVLAPELVDSICTLLGHPRECPHGGKIPEGECCRQAVTTVSSVVRPLSDVHIGEEVKVAYVNTSSNSRMHKLLQFGIIPGALVSVHQRYPSFVIVCGNNQIALEEAIAGEIYVWQKERVTPAAEPPREEHKRWRFRKGKG
jgi:DtxR family Mn-dependent transcriptional regulator